MTTDYVYYKQFMRVGAILLLFQFCTKETLGRYATIKMGVCLVENKFTITYNVNQMNFNYEHSIPTYLHYK